MRGRWAAQLDEIATPGALGARAGRAFEPSEWETSAPGG